MSGMRGRPPGSTASDGAPRVLALTSLATEALASPGQRPTCTPTAARVTGARVAARHAAIAAQQQHGT